MPKTHYSNEPDIEESYAETAWCGTPVGENYLFDSRWAHVTCQRCLRYRVKIENSVKVQEQDIVNQLGDMAEYFSKESNHA